MVAEEESLRERLLKSIALCRRELAALCQELQLAPFQVSARRGTPPISPRAPEPACHPPVLQEEEEATILQLEKDLRTRVEVMLKQKRERRQELRALQERDQELAGLLGQAPYRGGVSSDTVPTLAELDRFRRHLASLAAEKVWASPRGRWAGGVRQLGADPFLPPPP